MSQAGYLWVKRRIRQSEKSDVSLPVTNVSLVENNGGKGVVGLTRHYLSLASLSRFLPERRFDAEFVHGLNETAEVVSQDFAHRFIDLRRARLASETVAKLRLDHVEGGFDVGSFVIALHEAFLIERVEVKHSFSKSQSDSCWSCC